MPSHFRYNFPSVRLILKLQRNKNNSTLVFTLNATNGAFTLQLMIQYTDLSLDLCCYVVETSLNVWFGPDFLTVHSLLNKHQNFTEKWHIDVNI